MRLDPTVRLARRVLFAVHDSLQAGENGLTQGNGRGRVRGDLMKSPVPCWLQPASLRLVKRNLWHRTAKLAVVLMAYRPGEQEGTP
jgi:hypothetical protein